MRRRKRKRNLYRQIKIIEFRRQKRKRTNSRPFQKIRRMMVQSNIINVQEIFRTVNESKIYGKQLGMKDRYHQLETPEIKKRTTQPQIQRSKSTVIEGKNLFNSKIIQSPHNQHAIAARNRSKKMETEMFSPHFGSVVESDIQIKKKSINTINNKEICSFGEQSKEIFRSSLRQKILEQRNQKLVLDEQFEEIKKQSEQEESEIQKLGANDTINQSSESKLFVVPTILPISKDEKIQEEKSSIVPSQATQIKSITQNLQNPPPSTHNNRKVSMSNPSELLGQQVKEIIPSTAPQNQTFQNIFQQSTEQPTPASINTLTQGLFSQVSNPLQNQSVPILFMSNQKAPETSSVLAPAITQNVQVTNPPLNPKAGGLFGSNQNIPIQTPDQTAPLIFGASQTQNPVVQSQNTQAQVSTNQNQPQNPVVPSLFNFTKNQNTPALGLFSQNQSQTASQTNQTNSLFPGLFNLKAPVIQNPVQGMFSSQPKEQTILKDKEEVLIASTTNAQQPEVKQIGLFGKEGAPQKQLFGSTQVQGSLFQNTDDKAKVGLFQTGQQVQSLFGLNNPANKSIFGNISDNQPKQQDKQPLFGQQQSLFNFGSKEII